MRSHTLSAHKMRITKYKEVYGPLNLLEVTFEFLLSELIHSARRYGMPAIFVAN